MADLVLKTIILSIGILALIESIIAIVFPKIIIKLEKEWMKHAKAVRKVAIIEFIIALAFVLIVLFLL